MFFAVHELSPAFLLSCVVFCRLLFVRLSLFFWPLYCRLFLDLWLLITPLVSSILPSQFHQERMYFSCFPYFFNTSTVGKLLDHLLVSHVEKELLTLPTHVEKELLTLLTHVEKKLITLPTHVEKELLTLPKQYFIFMPVIHDLTLIQVSEDATNCVQ